MNFGSVVIVSSLLVCFYGFTDATVCYVCSSSGSSTSNSHRVKLGLKMLPNQTEDCHHPTKQTPTEECKSPCLELQVDYTNPPRIEMEYIRGCQDKLSNSPSKSEICESGRNDMLEAKTQYRTCSGDLCNSKKEFQENCNEKTHNVTCPFCQSPNCEVQNCTGHYCVESTLYEGNATTRQAGCISYNPHQKVNCEKVELAREKNSTASLEVCWTTAGATNNFRSSVLAGLLGCIWLIKASIL